MSAQVTPLAAPDRRQPRFPGLRVRVAQSYDFPAMARMANEIFQHERDIDHFDRYRSVKMGYEDEARTADRLLAAETDWRFANMRKNRRTAGRHFLVATYLKQPAVYLTSRHGAQPREEILGWAEWQDPTRLMVLTDSVPSDSLSDSDQTDDSPYKRMGKPDIALGELRSILKDMRFYHARQELLVPPNGLAVSLSETLESFDRAATNQPEDWKRWSKQFPELSWPIWRCSWAALGSSFSCCQHSPLGRLCRPPPSAMGNVAGKFIWLGHPHARIQR